MNALRWMVAVLVLTGLGAGPAPAVEFVEPAKPASAKVQGVRVADAPAATGQVMVPMITWGGDAATLHGNGGMTTSPDSLFGGAGLDIRLEKEDDFVAQVRNYLEGRTPFLRGTMGMINTYSEVLNADPRTRPVVFLQLTWSTGGDCLVVREGVRSPRDLRGKTILIQQYGPHVEYMDQILRDAGLSWGDVTIRWCEELFDLDGEPNDPASIMRVDPTIDAIFCISPDAAALTSNMTVGTGAEDSVEGARVLLSTKSASRVIADVYAVRSDFFEANRDWVERFTRAHFEAQSEVADLLDQSGTDDYMAFMRAGADALLDDPEATADMEGLMADCTLVRSGGNAEFFGKAGNLVGFEPVVRRNQEWLVTQGFVTAQQTLAQAGWDYGAMGAAIAAAPTVQFRPDEAAKAAQEVTDSGILFEFEIFFDPNEKEFDAAKYGDQFQRALELASTYGGALLEIVGHTDPTRLNQLMQNNPTEQVLQRQRQAGKVLSEQRSNAVKTSLMRYAESRDIPVNETQFITTGRGYDDPAVAVPTSREEMAANRRVQFRIINIEGELDAVAF